MPQAHPPRVIVRLSPETDAALATARPDLYGYGRSHAAETLVRLACGLNPLPAPLDRQAAASRRAAAARRVTT